MVRNELLGRKIEKENHMVLAIYKKGTKFDDFQKSVHISPLYSGNYYKQ